MTSRKDFMLNTSRHPTSARHQWSSPNLETLVTSLRNFMLDAQHPTPMRHCRSSRNLETLLTSHTNLILNTNDIPQT